MHREFRKVHNWNVANTVTSMRMAASLFLLFLPLKSIWFLVIYTIAGLTDVLDGWLARKTGRASEFGARLDSISDLLLYSVLLARVSDTSGRNLVCRIGNRTCAYCGVCHSCNQVSSFCVTAHMAEQVNRCGSISVALCFLYFVKCCV